jgi:hypothetical protein
MYDGWKWIKHLLSFFKYYLPLGSILMFLENFTLNDFLGKIAQFCEILYYKYIYIILDQNGEESI